MSVGQRRFVIDCVMGGAAGTFAAISAGITGFRSMAAWFAGFLIVGALKEWK